MLIQKINILLGLPKMCLCQPVKALAFQELLRCFWPRYVRCKEDTYLL